VAFAAQRSVVVAAMAVATVVVVGVVVATRHGTTTHRASSTTTPRSATTKQTTATPPAPTTTAPLVTPSGAVDAFTVSKASYTIVVQTANGACWVDMRNPAGTALFSGTLAARRSQSVTASAVTVRLGNPAAVTVSIDGTPVRFTIQTGSPATLHFQGSAPPA
jgi:hypothetical protein